MIVERISVQAKPGCRDAVLEMLKAEREEMDDPGRMRILSFHTGGSWNTIIYELTSENIEASEEAWRAWQARPDLAEFMQDWHQIVADWRREVWNIEE
jgi:hypothetical protein